MGKGVRLLRVLVHPSLESLEVIQALRDKGHTVMSAISPPSNEEKEKGSEPSPLGIWDFDLVLGPNCWRMDLTLTKYVELAVKSSRMEKYGAPSKSPSSRKEKSNESPNAT